MHEASQPALAARLCGGAQRREHHFQAVRLAAGRREQHGRLYREVWSHNRDLPRPASDPYSVVSTFRAPCDELDVTFVLDHMETRQFTSRRLNRGRLYLVDGVQNPNSLGIRVLERVPLDVKIPLPTEGGRAFYVLYSGHFGLFDAHCAVGAPPH
jgi:hypothetical protein